MSDMAGNPEDQFSRVVTQISTDVILFFQCCELLDILGIPYVQSQGEAEAMCAVLNAAGVGLCFVII